MDANVEYQLNLDLDPALLEKAKRELGETTDVVETSLKLMRKFLYAEMHREFTRIDDAFLLRFLRAKKFDVDKATKMVSKTVDEPKTVLKYVQMKKDCPELFQVSPIDELEFLLDMQMQWMLPEREAYGGRQVYIFRVEKCDPYKCPVEKVFRSNVLSLEHAIRQPEVQIGGLAVILDMSGLSFGHARFLSAHLSKRTVEVIQEAFPMRFKAFHILNEPFYMEAILAVLKPFLKEKIRKRIHLHGKKLESLYKFIPKEALPKEYGGTQPPFDNSQWKNSILADKEYFVRLERMHKLDDEGSFSPGKMSRDANPGLINAEEMDTESEESDKDCGIFYNCDSPQSDQISYLDDSHREAFASSTITTPLSERVTVRRHEHSS